MCVLSVEIKVVLIVNSDKMGKDRKRLQGDMKMHTLDEKTYLYYKHVSHAVSGDFESEEKRAVFINTVLKVISEEALKVSQDKTVSVIIEDLLQLANRNQLRAILNNFAHDWELACCDRSASFVTQSLLLHVNKFLGDSDCTSSDEEGKSIDEMIRGLVVFLNSQISFYMQHVSASHVLRVLIEILSGFQVSDRIIRGNNSQRREARKMELKKPSAQQYRERLQEIYCCIISLHKLEDHVQNNLSNPVLQTVLLSLQVLDTETSSRLYREMMINTHVFSPSSKHKMPQNLTHEIGSRLVEQFLVTMPHDVYHAVWETYFKGCLVTIAKHPVANFVLQKLISHVKTEEQFAEMFEELSADLESILALNHFGVIVALTESSFRCKAMEEKLIKSLQLAFHCHSPPERQCKLVPLLMALMTYEVFYGTNRLKRESNESGSDDSESEDDEVEIEEAEISLPKVTAVNYHGSIIIQNLLKFSSNRPIIRSLFELNPEELRNVCCDPCGSHVIEVFVTSDSVGEKSRKALYNKLKGIYVDLSCSKSGSRTFDALWNCASVEQKFEIAKELAKHEVRLKGNRFGYYIYSHCAVAQFKQRPECWKESQSKLGKKRPLKQNATTDSETQQPKKMTKLK